MTSSTTASVIPIVSTFGASASLPWARDTAAPPAVTSAVRRTAIPVAASHPKNAEPTLTPPSAWRSRATTVVRSISSLDSS
jgi:hypothetical protein